MMNYFLSFQNFNKENESFKKLVIKNLFLGLFRIETYMMFGAQSNSLENLGCFSIGVQKKSLEKTIEYNY